MPAFMIAARHAVLVTSQPIGSPRNVKQNTGCLPRSALSTAIASRFSDSERSITDLHPCLLSDSKRTYDPPESGCQLAPPASRLAEREVGRRRAITSRVIRPQLCID